eukprot:GFUD01012195.1.p1 GENE.GFUD01012195.1~~GFUD01012195.1.p1  ORF type:complete len:174 (+),score=42.96 GFUD01012195.1:75-596(+)
MENKKDENLENSVEHNNDDSEYVKNGSAALFFKAGAISVMLLGFIIVSLNIIFVSFGMHATVINFGEGIIAGVFYIVISLVLLIFLSKKTASAVRMMIFCNAFLLVIGITLNIINGFQIRSIYYSFKRRVDITGTREEQDLMIVLGTQMVAHMLVLLIGIVDILETSKLFKKA